MKTSNRAIIYLALGTNMGNREQNLLRTVAYLKNEFTELAVSPVYETIPILIKSFVRGDLVLKIFA